MISDFCDGYLILVTGSTTIVDIGYFTSFSCCWPGLARLKVSGDRKRNLYRLWLGKRRSLLSIISVGLVFDIDGLKTNKKEKPYTMDVLASTTMNDAATCDKR